MAAAHYAQALVSETLPRRASDAYHLAQQLFAVGLARSSPVSNLNLITLVDRTPTGQRIRFELHYANDLNDADAPEAHRAVSALSNAYGEQDTRRGKMIYAELWERAA
ncbi:hypothetical protein [Nonomuraea ceibae]|uniref:hypothetical protein n=1 Tax=Nonomuraea ceibae TaxID=1935170 RepID=UPI001C5FC2ED|nr:hypothetical protein [Nonomuraea ceibae]